MRTVLRAAALALAFAGTAPAADRTIVAFGDSITYGKGSSTNGPRTGYPAYLWSILGYNYPDRTFSVANEGISGETTSGGLARFEGVLDARRPDVVLIMEGTNDISLGVPFGTIQENLAGMAAVALARGVTPVLATVIPPHPALYRAQYLRTADFYNGGYVQSVCARLGIRCADQWAAFHAVPDFWGRLLNPASAEHPNDSGYAYAMAPAWYEALAPVLGIPFEPSVPSLSLTTGAPLVPRGGALLAAYALAPGNDLVLNAVDCYAAVLVPGGRLLFLDPGWAPAGAAIPFARAVLLDRVPGTGELPPLPIPAGAPAGRYTLFLAAARILHDPRDPGARTCTAELPFDVR